MMKILRPVPTVVTLLVAALLVSLFWRPIQDIQPQPEKISVPQTQAAALPWPAYGQQALGGAGYGVLNTHGQQSPVPIASITKMITALAVLKQKPLDVGQQGPLITISQSDVNLYNYYYSNDGSVAKVAAGEQISEYQALQAMLLPSANNVADTLADWAFGSKTAYLAYANQMVKAMGLEQTTVNGTNGFDSETTSTAQDLVKLGVTALDNSVIAQIVNQPSAVIPVAGTIRNYNWLLGEDGVIGIKTGNTGKAGGCFLFASKRIVSGQNITVVGAILGAPTLNQSIADARTVLGSVDSGFALVSPIKAGQTVGSYNTPWGAKADAVAKKSVSGLIWRGGDVFVKTNLDTISSGSPAGKNVGTLNVTINGKSESVPVALAKELSRPSISWRLRHL